ncbi:MAG: ankyrin repeat protein [Flavobacteriaceae bacterium]|jgi:ankyrin repeat protein
MSFRQFILVSALFLSGITSAQNDVFEASRSGNLSLLKELYQKDADVLNSLNENGFSPLILATYKHKVECVEFILSTTVDVNYQSQEGTALHAACYTGNLKIAQLLIDNGAEVNIPGGRQTSALIYAVQSKKEALVKLLVQNGADLTPKDQAGRTAWDYAVALELDPLLELLDLPDTED